MKKSTVTGLVIAFAMITLTSAAAYEFIPAVKKMFVSEHPDIPAFIEKSMAANKQEDIGKLKSLSDLGFTSFETKLKNIENRRKIDSVFSGYRFISDEVLGELLKKFRLAYSVVSDFTCEVPDANLKEIKDFRAKHPLVEKEEEVYDVLVFGGVSPEFRWDDKTGQVFRVTTNEFLIVAPSTCLVNTMGGYSIDGKEIVKDPIVLYQVDGGYIIVTSW